MVAKVHTPDSRDERLEAAGALAGPLLSEGTATGPEAMRTRTARPSPASPTGALSGLAGRPPSPPQGATMTRTARPRRRPTPTVDVHPGLLRAGDRVHPDDPLLFDATARVVVHGPPERLCDPATGAVVGWKVPLAPDGTVALVVPEGRKVRTRRRGTPHTLTPEQADLLVDDYPRRP